MPVSPNARAVLLASTLLAALPATQAAAALGDKPSFITGAVTVTHYDGVTNDLLTAGLGASGLGSATAPGFADKNNPTGQELRRSAIYNNYRALVDPTTGGGYMTFYGPNVRPDGTVTSRPGKVAGTEYILLTRVNSQHSNVFAYVSVVVQIPDSYDRAHGCLVAAPSSGSRGPYGAIATAGEWGLKHRCAVVYTDKGSGMGADDVYNNTVNLVRGTRSEATAAGGNSTFTARLSAAQRSAFNAATPYRFAFKHAHSQANPESDWGSYVLQSIEVAFWALNQTLAPSGPPYAINRSNTIVIASSVSNGGGSSLRAAELDTGHLIDGVAVAEPNVNPVFTSGQFSIQQGNQTPLTQHSLPLMNYITLENLYAGCAATAYPTGFTYLNLAASPARCASLQAAGLLTSTSQSAQAVEAQAKINGIGILPEQNFVSPSHWYAYVHQSISMTYANAYGKFGVADNLCDYSFGGTAVATAATPNVPVALSQAATAALFGNGNGIPPTGGVNLINNNAAGGPKEDRASSPDQNFAGALCLRALALGHDPATGAPLSAAQAPQASRIAYGVNQILASGDLLGHPAVWVQGRNDGILPPNFTGRAYYGLNQVVEGGANVRYYEVKNAQHLDSFNQYPGYNSSLVPLHVYFLQAMDMMYDHIVGGAPLLPSQVVRTTPRGTGAPPLTSTNIPKLQAAPPAGDQITFSGGVLSIPE